MLLLFSFSIFYQTFSFQESQEDGLCHATTFATLFDVFHVERGSSVVECRTGNQVSPGSNPPLLPFRRLGIFVLSIDAPVDSAV